MTSLDELIWTLTAAREANHADGGSPVMLRIRDTNRGSWGGWLTTIEVDRATGLVALVADPNTETPPDLI